MATRRFAMAAVVALCVVYALAAPAVANETFVDQVINHRTVTLMRHGSSYYAAMDDALRQYNGVPTSVRDFREPAVFLVWAAMPSQEVVWWLFVAMVAATGIVLIGATDTPLVVPLVVLYLLRAGRPHVGGAWYDQYLIVELWVALPTAVVVAMTRRRDATSPSGSGRALVAAVGGAVVATIMRELAVVLVVGGLIDGIWRRKREWLAWAVGLVVMIPIGLVHAVWASHYLGSAGHEAPLLGTGGVGRMISMATVSLPLPQLAALLMWIAALARVVSDAQLRWRFGPLCALPLLGLAVGRDYWGYLVVPFVIFWAGEEIGVVGSRLVTMSKSTRVTSGAPARSEPKSN